MAKKIHISGETFPFLNSHYDPCDKGHTKGHYEHFYSLYEQSIENAKSIEEKEAIEAEKERFEAFVSKFDTEYFKLKAC